MAPQHLKDKTANKGLFDIPFALLIGPQRAGTTWVDRYLRFHGDICLPDGVKEVFFFDRNFDRGLKFYKSHFNIEPHHIAAMEITATSFDHPEAPARIKNTLGDDVALVCPLRHPITRSYSLYLHYLRYGIVTGTLQDAVRQVPQIITSSYYAEHVKRWFDVFGREKIKFIYQEELENNQIEFVQDLCAGLNIPYIPPSEEVQGRYNITTFSKFSAVSLTAQKIADFLRYYRLYFIINFAKSIGLKRLVFGKERPDAKKDNIPESDLLWLQEKLGYEVKKFEALMGVPVPYWKNLYKDN